MLHYLSMMMAISDIFLLLDGSAAAKQKENELWAYLKAHTSAGVYRSIRYGFGGVTNLKIPKGDKLVLAVTALHRRFLNSINKCCFSSSDKIYFLTYLNF